VLAYIYLISTLFISWPCACTVIIWSLFFLLHTLTIHLFSPLKQGGKYWIFQYSCCCRKTR
ncbi:hypothetical protein L9F63_020748, partial [Diploptera punctata]